MKAFLLTFTAVIIAIAAFAQTPQSFNYQAVLRDANGQVLANHDVEIGIVLLQGSATGTEVFSEIHPVTTNGFGLANLQIGSENTTGMENIDWNAGPYFIKISVDGSVMGTSQLLSVPYALFAGAVAGGDNDPQNEIQTLAFQNNQLSISSGNSIDLSPVIGMADTSSTNELQDISLSGTELSISQGSTVDLSGLRDGTGTDEQTLKLYNNRTLHISNGNYVTLPYVINEQDGDETNELQTLSISNDTIYLTDGGKVKLPAETDPVFTAWDKSTGITITESQITGLKHFTGDSITGNEAAFDGWDKDASDDFTTGDETDPVYAADSAFIKTGIRSWNGSLAKNINQTDTTRWGQDVDPTNELQALSISNDTIYLTDGGKVKLPAETDPEFTTWDKSTGIKITESQITDLKHFTGDSITGDETAFDGWDKDASDDFTTGDETDPVYAADSAFIKTGIRSWNGSLAKNINQTDTTRWGQDVDPTNELQILSLSNDTIYLTDGGKVKLPAETDPEFTTWDKSTGIKITESQITDLKHFTGDSITGDETAFDGWDKDASDDFTTSDETDPVYAADSSFLKTGIRSWNGSLAKNINQTDTTRWGQDVDPTNELQILSLSNDTIYLTDGGKVKLPAETDPEFTTWDKSTGIKITESQITDLKHFTGDSITGDETAFDDWDKDASDDFTTGDETDPVYAADSAFIKTGIRSWNGSLAKNINQTDTTRWGQDVDPANELQALSISNDTIYLSNGGFVKLPAGNAMSLDAAYDNGRKITADAGAFEVNGNSGVLFTGTFSSSDTIPASGEGTRMMWYPAKAAFRAGRVYSTRWDSLNIGNYSVAMGYNTEASGDFGSTAMGYNTIASEEASTAMGKETKAQGNSSTAMGYKTTASGSASTAMGQETKASGEASTAMGYKTTASGWNSTAMGYETTASGEVSTAMGNNTKAQGKTSTAMGQSTTARGSYSTSMGFWTTASGGFTTAMGEETTASGGHSISMGKETTASGGASIAAGFLTTASGECSLAMGQSTTARGTYSTAMGFSTTASGNWGSTAIGYCTTASGNHSLAMGEETIASGGSSLATGYLTTASGGNSTAMGRETVAIRENSTAIGMYNLGLENAIFEIGRGDWNTRENALTVLNNGNVGIGFSNPEKKLEVNGNAYLSGNVGIGTNSSDYPLEVNGSHESESHTFAYLQYHSIAALTGKNTATRDYSIVASNKIRAEMFCAISDRRIKTNIQATSGKTDLDLVNKMEVVDYQYIDKIEKGNIIKKGFIAQQIEEVLPDAVAQSKAFIPDIYKKATAVVVDSVANTITVTTPLEHNLQEGDMLRFITTGGTHEEKVLSVFSDSTFTVQKPEGDCSEVFVYGKKVDDFRAIDYDQVFSAGIGAIQELSRQNNELKQTIENLQNANTALKAEKDSEVQDLQQRLETLEALVKNVLNENKEVSAQK